MLSSEDHPGLFTFMVGVIVVVFAGVALSLMMDRKFSFSASVSALDRGIKASAEEIMSLQADLEESSRNLNSREPKLKQTAANHETVRRQLAADTQKCAILTETRSNLQKAIPALEEEFSKYREKYRTQARAAAVGESLGTLSLRGGREYRQVVINQVTEVGLEIRHQDGIARIQAPDLDQTFQDRFQWNDEERRSKLKEEHAMSEAITAKPEEPEITNDVPVRPVPAGRAGALPDEVKIDALRAKVIKWKSKVSILSMERSNAVSSASYGSRSSVPGSLETWQAKANRLTSELAKARGELAAAKAALEVVAPNDPLLRPDPVRE
jgi:hypothetical protein